MRKLLLTTVVCVLFSGQAFAMSDAECTSLWSIADVNGDDTLTGTEGDRYLAMMRIANETTNTDSPLTETTFKQGCKTDLFKIADVDEGAPLTGANSFTETQAKDRALANGFVIMGLMTKDNMGIWRGSAIVDGKNMSIAVDFKGNVVSQ